MEDDTVEAARSVVTVQEVRDYITVKRGEGLVCPCCDRWLKVYRRKFNGTMARSVIWVAYQRQRQILSGGNSDWVHVQKLAPAWLLRSKQLSITSKWDLVRAMPNENNPKVKGSGWWRETEKGLSFVRNQAPIPEYAYLYNNSVIGFSEELVYARDTLPVGFDYRDIMDAV
jgi:hypothetical protein